MAELEEAAAKLHEQVIEEQEEQTPAPEENLAEETEVEDVTEAEEPAEKAETEEEAEDDAEAYEMDAEQLASLLGLKSENIIIDNEGQVRFKGKLAEATPEEYVNAYQQQANLSNRSKEVAEAKKQAEELVQSLQSQHEQQIQQSAAFLELVENELLGPYQNVDWDRLRSEDSGRYAAVMADFNQAKSRFQEMQENVVSYLKEQQGKIDEQIKQQQSEYLQKQKEVLSDFSWWNDGTAKEITDYLKSAGFSEQEISATADARSIKLAYLAMQHEKGTQKVAEKTKKPLPKVIKPGAKKSTTDINEAKVRDIRKRLKKSGNLEDAVSLFRETGKR